MPDKKRIALITGASSGLGREFARLLAREAVDELWLVARRGERLRALSAELAVPCRIFALDLTREVALEELSAALAAEPVVVRYLVNAAGFGRIGMAADIGAATTGRMIALNCRAAAELTERALPYMERGSRVLEIASCAAFQPIPYLAAYAATKAFLLRYSRALAAEVAARGITVTAICPYWIRDTEFIHEAKKTDRRGLFRGFPPATCPWRSVSRSPCPVRALPRWRRPPGQSLRPCGTQHLRPRAATVLSGRCGGRRTCP